MVRLLWTMSRTKMGKASVSTKTQEYLKDTLPALKAACPTEANSIRDLENGNYLKKLAADTSETKKGMAPR